MKILNSPTREYSRVKADATVQGIRQGVEDEVRRNFSRTTRFASEMVLNVGLQIQRTMIGVKTGCIVCLANRGANPYRRLKFPDGYTVQF